MPIKASADKLAREMQQYGNPPVFPVDRDSKIDKANDNNNNYKSKRSKAVAKSGSHKSQ
jgi:leucyl-tRNA synthetase